MDIVRETGRRFIINNETITTRRVTDGDNLASALNFTGGIAKKKKVKPHSGISKEFEAVATYMVRGFHDWMLPQYYLEPGFRSLIGNKTKDITIHYLGLRDDWEDDCRRALDAWQNLGFNFVEISDPSTADIVVDDEKKGAYALRRFVHANRGKNNKPVIHTSTREINIWKEWPEWHMYDAILHEVGHVLGLGHPGPYNGSKPKTPKFKEDNSKNTIMSYYGVQTGKLGEIDKIAIEMIYG